jgi:hypothetical protein
VLAMAKLLAGMEAGGTNFGPVIEPLFLHAELSIVEDLDVLENRGTGRASHLAGPRNGSLPQGRGGGETRRRGDAAAGRRGGGETRRRRDAAAEGRGGGETRRRRDAAAEWPLVVSAGLRSRSQHRVGRSGGEPEQLEPLVRHELTEPGAVGHERLVQEQVAEAWEDDQGVKAHEPLRFKARLRGVSDIG